MPYTYNIDNIDGKTNAGSTVLSYEYYSIDVQANNCQIISLDSKTKKQTSSSIVDTGKSPSENAIKFSSTDIPNEKNDYICFHIENFTPSVASNVYYPAMLNSYQSTELFIMNKNNSHMIATGLILPAGSNELCGELVIKHTSKVSNIPDLYLCFLLYDVNGDDKNNDLDSLIEKMANGFTKTTEITYTSLSKAIPVQTSAIQYADEYSDLVIVFSTPFQINKNSATYLKQLKGSTVTDNNIINWLVPPDLKKAITLTEKNIKPDNQNNELYMDCQPVGESNETIQAYQIPINSEYTENASQLTLMKNTINFSALLVSTSFVYSLFPSFYQGVILRVKDKFKTAGGQDKINLPEKRLDSFDAWYIIFLLSFSIINMVLAICFNFNLINLLACFIGVFIFVLSINLMYFQRFANNKDYAGLFGKIDFSDFYRESTLAFFELLILEVVTSDPYYLKRIFYGGIPIWLPIIITIGVTLGIIAGIYGKVNPPIDKNGNGTTAAGTMGQKELAISIIYPIYSLFFIWTVFAFFKSTPSK